VSFPAPNIDLQTSTGICRSLKRGASAPFFIPANATDIHQQPAFLRPKLRPKNVGGAGSGLLLGLDRDDQQH
ncbi:hypothetical protein, partial [Pseudomonas avellanae]|uniref:hypothetical protein n=1 Tax=Pseudomonas avellanae TaxID=46257 RepID=UPI00195524A8